MATWKCFPAKRESYEDMLAFVDASAKKYEIPEKRQLYLQLGFEEAVVNVLSYAYPPEQEGKVWLQAVKEGDRFILKLADMGKPFNPLISGKEPFLAEKLEDQRIGGFGIDFMKKIFDDVQYSQTLDDGSLGNVLTLVMKL